MSYDYYVPGLWTRMSRWARAHELSCGLGVDHTSAMMVAHVGKAMGVGPTSNIAINRCADELIVLHNWKDDRGQDTTAEGS